MTTTLQTINIGNIANDGTGDSLRIAFGKINNNFTAISSSLNNGWQTSKITTVGNISTPSTSSTVLMFTISATELIHGTFQINSSDITSSSSANSQNIVINCAMNNGGNSVSYNGHSTLFMPNGNSAVCTYSMDVSSGNVRMFASHLSNTDTTLSHTVTYNVQGQSQFAVASYLTTESGEVLTTEYSAIIGTES